MKTKNTEIKKVQPNFVMVNITKRGNWNNKRRYSSL